MIQSGTFCEGKGAAEKMKNVIYRNRIPLICAAIQWYVTVLLQVDRAFFTYDRVTRHFMVVKFCYLIFLMAAWCFGVHVYRELKKQNTDYQRGVRFFLSYLTVMLALLMVLWPGTWSDDDIITLKSIREYYSFLPWQHILTGLYQDVLLQILPFPGGIILLQNVIISICVAFCVTKLEKIFSIRELKNGILDVILKLIPFFLPPVLMYQFSGYRMGLYVYLEMTMLVMLIGAVKEKSQWNWYYTLLFAFLATVVSVWRTESFLYIPCISILLLAAPKTTLNWEKKCVCILILLLGCLGINRLQNNALGNSNYQVISLLRPCAEVVRVSDPEADAAELAAIDKVANLEVIRSNPALNGEGLYWSTDCVRTQNADPDDDYTEEDYRNFVKAFVKLSLKYPRTVIKERWDLFVAGAGITGNTISNATSAALYDEVDTTWAVADFHTYDYKVNKPVFMQLRRVVVNLLSGRNIDGSTNRALQLTVWNALLPIAVLLFVWVKLLLQKKWYLWLLCSAVVVKLPLIVLTQPGSWFMYLLSFYLLGYVLVVFLTWIYLSRKNGDVHENE